MVQRMTPVRCLFLIGIAVGSLSGPQPARAERIQFSLGPSFYQPELSDLRLDLVNNGEGPLNRASWPSFAANVRVDTRWFWLACQYERYRGASEREDTEVEIDSVVPSVQFRVDLLNVIPYFGVGYNFASAEVRRGFESIPAEEFDFQGAGVVLQIGMILKIKRWLGAEIGIVYRPENEIDNAGREYEVSDLSATVNWSAYF